MGKHDHAAVKELCMGRLFAAAVAALACAAVIVFGPKAPHVDDTTTGDRQLAARVRSYLGDTSGYRALHITEITPEGTKNASIGRGVGDRIPTETTPMKLSEAAETFTGQLFADAIARGEVGPKDRLADYLTELKGTDAGGVTLEELASHRGGLSLGSMIEWKTMHQLIFGESLSHTTSSQMLEYAKSAKVDRRGEFEFSDFDSALLGAALAKAARFDSWEAYVKARLFNPLEMANVSFAKTRGDVPGNAFIGSLPNGRRVQTETAEALLPSGIATFVTPADMARYAGAVLDGSVPGGAAAQKQRWQINGTSARMGYLWLSRKVRGHTISYCSGSTSDFSSILAVDREAGKAVIVFADTGAADGETLAFNLLAGESRHVRSASARDVALTLPNVAILLAASLAFAVFAVLSGDRVRSRVALAIRLMDLVAWGVLFVVLRLSPYVPEWTMALYVGPAVYAAVRVRTRWKEVPTCPPSRGWYTLVRLASSMVFAAIVGWMAWPK
jgi:Beta-lactamase class C and other penicillin binding proteins